MTADFSMLLLAGVLAGTGAYMLLERTLIKMLLGIMLASNGINLLILTAGGPPGNPPIRGRGLEERATDSDPLVQAMILTAIVITAGIAAFILALMYRSYKFTTDDEIADDFEDTKIVMRSPADMASAPDRDRSDDQLTGEPTEMGDHVEYYDDDSGYTSGDADDEQPIRDTGPVGPARPWSTGPVGPARPWKRREN